VDCFGIARPSPVASGHTHGKHLTGAVQEEKIQAVEALVAAGWDINSTVGTAGMYNMLISCAEVCQWQLLTWLLGRGSGYTVLHLMITPTQSAFICFLCMCYSRPHTCPAQAQYK
jgi:hypothetical protein